MEDVQVGSVVELNDGRLGTIRFLGSTLFAPGEWIGVEFEDPTGKNDGSVQGERYFDCPQGHGMFLRRTGIASIVEQPAPPHSKPKATVQTNGGANGRARPQSQVVEPGRRQSVMDRSLRRQTLNAESPTPGSRVPPRAIASPVKSPTKQLHPPSSTSSSRTGTPPVTSTAAKKHVSTTTASKARPSIGGPATISTAARRTSMAPPPPPSSTSSRTSRLSLAGPPSGLNRSTAASVPATRTTSNRLSMAPRVGQAKRLSSVGGASQASEDSPLSQPTEDHLSPTAESDEEGEVDRKAAQPAPQRMSIGRAVSTSGQSARPAPSATLGARSVGTTASKPAPATAREVEELKAKLRVMEKKRMEDREKLNTMENLQQERDRFQAIIQKLQTKMQPQQQEIQQLRQALKDSEVRLEDIEKIQAEHDAVVEMATLDREMAEETAEVLKTEVDALKSKLEELELEVEILREENEEMSKEMSPGERSSQGWLQMEKSNERLREALLRLRDMTHEQDEEYRAQVKSLEADVEDLTKYKQDYDSMKTSVEQTNADMEELRQQLEAALGAEDMIEELTERNFRLQEQIEQLRATVEDLESLKELNDELEINHVETEKQMQEEIDYKDSVLGEFNRRATQQDETLEDYEYTIARFRELVTNLQSDLEDMRASRQISETEAEELTNRSRAMMDLNMKLQIDATKTQVKTIDLELRRLEAQEAAEHLAIVQLFLPEAFHTERDSVLALLRFKRIGFKANLLHGFIRERVNGQSARINEEDIFAACDVLDKLTWIAAMCERFINSISGCSVEQFNKYEGALYELEPVERALNRYIDALKREELKERQIAEELKRSMALMTHLAEVQMEENLEGYADQILMRTMLMQSHLENTASALTLVKNLVQAKVSSVAEDGESDELGYLITKADQVTSHTRSAKVIVGKAIRSLEELKARSLSLGMDTQSTFIKCEEASQEVAHYARQLGENVAAAIHEEDRTTPLTVSEVQTIMYNTTSSAFDVAESDPFSVFSTKLRSLSDLLVDLGSLTSDLDLTVEFERQPAPWILRSKELRAKKITSIDAEQEMQRLREEVHERATQIRLREQSLEEAAVKIELLEARMRDASKKNARIAELERTMEESRDRERQLREQIKTQTRDLQVLESEREKWKQAADERKMHEVDEQISVGAEKAVATARQMEDLRSQIRNLEGAVRYLREDNRRARFTERNGASLAWLDQPLVSPKTSTEKERIALVAAEGKDVLSSLIDLVTSTQPVDLAATLPENKLAWRPAKKTAKFQVLRQEEELERWRAWRQEVVRKGQVLTMSNHRHNIGRRELYKLPQKGGDVVNEIKIVSNEPSDEYSDALETF